MSIYKFQYKELQAYSSIYTAVQNLNTCAQIPSIPLENALSVYKKVLSESPFGYMYNQNQIRARSGLRGCEINFDLCKEFVEGRISVDIRIVPEVDRIISLARKQRTAYEAVRVVYAYFVNNFEYAYEQMNDLMYHSALSVFLYRKSVCEGLAMALSLVLNKLGVPCGIVTGTSKLYGTNGAHAWNVIELGSNFYHLDVTWDICTKEKGSSYFDYFLLDDYFIGKDHYWDDESIPTARDQTMEMYAHEGLCCQDKQGCIDLILQGLTRRKNDIGFRYIGIQADAFVNSENISALFGQAANNGQVTYRSVSFSINKSAGTVHFQVTY